jgi:mannose-6-phosphate isomerase-like protein (cupin superfamily)
MTRTIHNPVLRDTVTFLTTAKESRGAVTELEATVMPGGSNPPHFHRTYDEIFIMLEGSLRLESSRGFQVDLCPNDQYVVKAGQVHSLRNVSDLRARIRTQIVPGNEGFENSLRIMYGLASDGLYHRQRRVPRSFQHLALCMSMSDTCIPGPLSFLNTGFRLAALFARWRGVEKQLLSRYCR